MSRKRKTPADIRRAVSNVRWLVGRSPLEGASPKFPVKEVVRKEESIPTISTLTQPTRKKEYREFPDEFLRFNADNPSYIEDLIRLKKQPRIFAETLINFKLTGLAGVIESEAFKETLFDIFYTKSFGRGGGTKFDPKNNARQEIDRVFSRLESDIKNKGSFSDLKSYLNDIAAKTEDGKFLELLSPFLEQFTDTDKRPPLSFIKYALFREMDLIREQLYSLEPKKNSSYIDYNPQPKFFEYFRLPSREILAAKKSDAHKSIKKETQYPADACLKQIAAIGLDGSLKVALQTPSARPFISKLGVTIEAALSVEQREAMEAIDGAIAATKDRDNNKAGKAVITLGTGAGKTFLSKQIVDTYTSGKPPVVDEIHNIDLNTTQENLTKIFVAESNNHLVMLDEAFFYSKKFLAAAELGSRTVEQQRYEFMNKLRAKGATVVVFGASESKDKIDIEQKRLLDKIEQYENDLKSIGDRIGAIPKEIDELKKKLPLSEKYLNSLKDDYEKFRGALSSNQSLADAYKKAGGKIGVVLSRVAIFTAISNLKRTISSPENIKKDDATKGEINSKEAELRTLEENRIRIEKLKHDAKSKLGSKQGWQRKYIQKRDAGMLDKILGSEVVSERDVDVPSYDEAKQSLDQIVAEKIPSLVRGDRFQYILPHGMPEIIGAEHLVKIAESTGAEIIITPTMHNGKICSQIFQTSTGTLSAPIAAEDLQKELTNAGMTDGSKVISFFGKGKDFNNAVGGDYEGASTGITRQIFHLKNPEDVTMNDVLQWVGRARSAAQDVKQTIHLPAGYNKNLLVESLQEKTVSDDRARVIGYLQEKLKELEGKEDDFSQRKKGRYSVYLEAKLTEQKEASTAEAASIEQRKLIIASNVSELREQVRKREEARLKAEQDALQSAQAAVSLVVDKIEEEGAKTESDEKRNADAALSSTSDNFTAERPLVTDALTEELLAAQSSIIAQVDLLEPTVTEGVVDQKTLESNVAVAVEQDRAKALTTIEALNADSAAIIAEVADAEELLRAVNSELVEAQGAVELEPVKQQEIAARKIAELAEQERITEEKKAVATRIQTLFRKRKAREKVHELRGQKLDTSTTMAGVEEVGREIESAIVTAAARIIELSQEKKELEPILKRNEEEQRKIVGAVEEEASEAVVLNGVESDEAKAALAAKLNAEKIEADRAAKEEEEKELERAMAGIAKEEAATKIQAVGRGYLVKAAVKLERKKREQEAATTVKSASETSAEIEISAVEVVSADGVDAARQKVAEVEREEKKSAEKNSELETVRLAAIMTAVAEEKEQVARTIAAEKAQIEKTENLKATVARKWGMIREKFQRINEDAAAAKAQKKEAALVEVAARVAKEKAEAGKKADEERQIKELDAARLAKEKAEADKKADEERRIKELDAARLAEEKAKELSAAKTTTMHLSDVVNTAAEELVTREVTTAEESPKIAAPEKKEDVEREEQKNKVAVTTKPSESGVAETISKVCVVGDGVVTTAMRSESGYATVDQLPTKKKRETSATLPILPPPSRRSGVTTTRQTATTERLPKAAEPLVEVPDAVTTLRTTRDKQIITDYGWEGKEVTVKIKGQKDKKLKDLAEGDDIEISRDTALKARENIMEYYKQGSATNKDENSAILVAVNIYKRVTAENVRAIVAAAKKDPDPSPTISKASASTLASSIDIHH